MKEKDRDRAGNMPAETVRARIQEGIDSAKDGKTFSLEEVRDRLIARIRAKARKR